ncbi:torsin-1A-interacting protein 2-like [Oratosquilla oratoria]|uniref:torsin-1A-interacting protein 2-like n=1 Tax=Oratosquilla oratoria TaxID=337810 RepID=UPI003F777378
MATARPGLRSVTESPPGHDERSPRTRQKVSPQSAKIFPKGDHGSNLHHSPSPIRGRETLRGERSPEFKVRNDCEDSDEEIGEDEVDRCSPKHTSHLYPDLNEVSPSLFLDSSSPGGTQKSPLLDNSFTPSHTQCYTKVGKGRVVGESLRSRNQTLPKTPPKTPPRQPQPDVEKKGYQNAKFGPNPLIAIFIFVIICCVAVFAAHILFSSKRSVAPKEAVSKTLEEIAKDLKNDLKTLHHHFPQTKHFWTQMMGEIRAILAPNPEYPTVILFIVPKGAEKTATCLIQKVSYAVKTAFEDLKAVSFDVRTHLKNSTWLKYEMDMALKELDRSHVATIYNLELIPGNAAMMLHAYCDHENAPFKQVVILLTLEVDKSYEEIEASLDSTVSTVLNHVWATELETKDIAALLSRIGNAPVVVQPVEKERLDYVCPL